jgi:CRISPR-associated protein Csm2
MSKDREKQQPQRSADQHQKTFNQGNSPQSNNNRENPKTFFDNHSFKKEWILSGADKDMIKYAEEFGEYMAPKGKDKNEKNRDNQCLTKSQIRNVFGELKRIQGDFKSNKSSFYLLKAKVAYAEGRNNTMGMRLFKLAFDEGWNYVGDNEKYFINFCYFIEAILAYHKAHGGKD